MSVQLVSGPANGDLTLMSDGSFTYDPDAGFIGDDSFVYEAVSDVDPDNPSAPTTVDIMVGPPPYGFVNVQNLPPNGNRAFNSGSAVPLTFQLTLNGQVVDSSDADPVFTITGPDGIVILIDPGNSDLRYQNDDNKWTVNFQTQDESGDDLPAGVYDIKITINKTGQTFPLPGEPPIEIELR